MDVWSQRPKNSIIMKKFLSLVALLFCFSVVSLAQSGSCGVNLTWELSDSTLTISGYGPMDYSYLDPSSWNNYKSQIARVSLPEGLTSISYSAFSNCDNLRAITIPGSVVSIGDYAFQSCDKLTKVVIKNGVQSIGYCSFDGCNNMAEINLPSSLLTIDKLAFCQCSSLTSISIPEKITTIYGSTFAYCSSLKEVTLPKNLQIIYGNAFSGCGIISIVIPNSVTTLGEGAFSNCTNLTSVSLSNNLSTIPKSAFSGCENLTSVSIPKGVTTIGSSAFWDCTNLTSVSIPEGVTTIEAGAFYHCGLTTLTLPNSLQTIKDPEFSNNAGAFHGNYRLTKVVIPGNVTRIGGNAFSECTSLSQVTLSEGITTIGFSAFQACSSLRSITLPEGLTTIEAAAFYGCDLVNVSLPSSLKTIEDCAYQGRPSSEYGTFGGNKNLASIIIPNGVTKIGSFAFQYCTSLQTIVLSNELLTLGESAFYSCSSLSSINIPKKVCTIQAGTFHGCSSLSQVTLPEGLTTIENNAFYNCSSLKTIQLPKTVTSLNSAFAYSGLVEIEIPEGVAVLNHTFYECNKLSKVILPTSLTTIDEWSFYNCTSLTTMTLPQSVRLIGGAAFYGCTSLSQINLPQAITTIESSAFTYCSSLREITIPDKVTAIDRYVFQGCTSLTSVTLSNNITTIGDRAFENCSSLTSITLPSELTFIEYTAFQNCKSLYSITIPSKVTQLGASIFNGCTSLASINMLPATPPTINEQYAYTFNGVPSTAVIKVPCKNMEAYLTDSIWNATVTLPIQELPANIVTVKSNDNRMGEAFIVTPNTCTNDEATIQAIPREGCEFAAWNDGNTENPRVVTITEDVTYTAIFEAMKTYQLTVNYDKKQGHVAGVGEYYPGEEATLTVTALGGYRFSKWGDGNTDNPRTIVMNQDITLAALFIKGDYCGDNILYTIQNDTLALNGSGDMWNLSEFGWKMYADDVMTLQLSNGITSLGTNAFMDLMFVSEVTIPATVKTIHKRAFENCRSLTDVTFASYSQLKTIDHWAFYECINLQSIHIPEGVTTIGNGAFYGCAYLDSLTLPSTLESIADNGFALCAKLKQMRVHATEPPIVDSKTFENVDRSIPVYVPYGTGNKYRNTEIWKEFDIRDEADFETGFENINTDSNQVMKVIQGGQLLIIRDGKTYNALGQELQAF